MSSRVVNLFVPNRTNNYKAALLHNLSLAAILIAVITIQSFLFFTHRATQVLGTTTDLTSEKIIELTNHERQAVGLPILTESPDLNQAAQAKINDMFEFNYWNHYSPSRRAPWKFIIDSGYSYQFAGENLGRDFSTSEKLVAAWMASQGHKDNILKPEYKDIGIAIGEGLIDDTPTVLIVQFFAARPPAGQLSIPHDEANSEEVFTVAGGLSDRIEGKSSSSIWTTQVIALSAILSLMFILTLDIIVLKKFKKIPRISAKYWAHMVFLFTCSLISYVIIK